MYPSDISNPMAQLEIKLSEGFDALKDCDGYLDLLAGNLSRCEAQVEHRRRSMGGVSAYSAQSMNGY